MTNYMVNEFKTTEAITKGLRLGSLADSGVFGLTRYLHKKENNEPIDNNTKFLLNRAIDLLEEIEQKLEITNGDQREKGISWDLYLSSNREIKDLGLDGEVRLLRDSDKRKEYKEIIEDIISGSKDYREDKITEMKNHLGEISSVVVGHAFSIVEAEEYRWNNKMET